MKKLTSEEIRNMWLGFFIKKGATKFESAPLIPINDPSLLWINAGVTPLKKYFDGRERPISNKLVSIQKCIRTNDIENVGNTARHHTFFEMLGNFSVGDYFKKEAISWAYEILTSPEWFSFDLNKLYITCYPDDNTTYNIWINQGIDKSHIIKSKDNFWEIGNGPCGPCTEIYYDRGESFDKRGPELIEKDIENDRFIEIWNIVFSSFDAKEGTPRSEYKELPSKNIDTGAGLERFACIIQNCKTNFETDLFMPLINKIEEISKVKYQGQKEFKIISDHIKTITMAMFDGAGFSNEGRGYVLKRLLRRALKSGIRLGINTYFLYLLVDIVFLMMHKFYNLDKANLEHIKNNILEEEKRFLENLKKGEAKIKDLIKSGCKKISGKDAFILFDTYGFPIDLTVDVANDNNIKVDIDSFKKELEYAQQRSRKNQKDSKGMENQNEEFLKYTDKSIFLYDTLEKKAKVIKVFKDGIVLDETPFYAESGGQVSDCGYINDIKIIDIKKLPNGQNLHILEKNIFKIGDIVNCVVDKKLRNETMKNHTATHLLQKALKIVLGNHINQQGSKVAPNFLRFDFNHFKEISNDEIIKIEEEVKKQIKKSQKVNISQMNIEDAKKIGAMALFGEKYKDIVRVVNINNYSIELCGGTHVKNTSDINDFAIVQILSIGSGIYRALAITGDVKTLILDEIKEYKDEALKIKDNFKSKIAEPKICGSYQDIINFKKYLGNLKEEKKLFENKNKEKNAIILKDKIKSHITNDKTQIINLTFEDSSLIKDLLDCIFNEYSLDNLIIINKLSDKMSYFVKSKNNAKEIISKLNTFYNGRGGGNDKFAQGSGFLKEDKFIL